MATSESGIHVVKDVKTEKSEKEKFESDAPDFVKELEVADLGNDRIFRLYLTANLVGLRVAVENLVEEFRKAPVQRTMQMQLTPEMQMQAMKMLGVKPPGGPNGSR